MISTLPSWLPRSVSALIATSGLFVLTGLSLAGCAAPPDSGSDAATESDTIPIAVRGDEGPTSDVERTLDRIADEIGAGSDTLMETMPGVYDVVGARRLEDFAVEFVYRYAEPVDPDIRAVSILGGVDVLAAYMETTFYPIADRLGVPDTLLAYSYFQPDGELVVSIVCQHKTWEASDGSWHPGGGPVPAGSGSSCNESPTLTDWYATGHLVAP